ncbi:MAG TPA: flavodoxin domain-containing protein [Myxococcales bacterium]|nr:flavodoxin domain-containing protein [Myxococcales bacterium]
MRVLIAYGTTEGMTRRIAERMAEVAGSLGHAVEILDTGQGATRPLEGYDAVLVGASVHLGRHQRAVRRFIAAHEGLLGAAHTGFFSVCLAIASKNERERREARRTAEAFPESLGWRPDVVQVFGGALMLSKYGFLTRLVMRAIARREQGGDVPMDRDTVYTDWAAVERFVKDFLGPRAEEPIPARLESSTESVHAP